MLSIGMIPVKSMQTMMPMRTAARCGLLMAGAIAIVMASARPAFTSGLRIADVHVAGGDAVTCTLRWEHGWRTDRNHDAAWLFVKQRNANGAWQPVLLRADGHTLTAMDGGPAGRVQVSADRVGVFIMPAAAHRGPVAWTVRLALAPEPAPPTGTDGGKPAPARPPLTDADVQAFGLEMVFVPSGTFTIGDPDPAALAFGAVFKSDARGEPDGLVTIASEGPIDVGPRAGAFYYKAQQKEYQGDQLGPIPATFPKGVNAFYAMKYEITQGQYAAFLNTLGSTATYFRAIHGGRGYSNERGTIAYDGRAYVASAPNRPANFISWDDGLAFADWAGLRPMTELEFEKACRGSSPPIAHEFPWGTASADRLRRVMGPDDDLVTTGDADESRLTDATRDVLGASFYWVMDLAGSVWERVVTFGHPRGRAFRGTHGDGRLTGHGDATNDDWPLGDHEAGGYGYRGGGFYERGMKFSEFNPYSPIAYRRFGSWGGAPRSIAYGFRAVRNNP